MNISEYKPTMTGSGPMTAKQPEHLSTAQQMGREMLNWSVREQGEMITLIRSLLEDNAKMRIEQAEKGLYAAKDDGEFLTHALNGSFPKQPSY